MTGLLTDLMHERADGLDQPALDVDALVRAGNGRVRRRRAGLVGAGAAAAVLAVVAVPVVLSGGVEPGTAIDADLAAAFATHEPSYAVGSVVHVNGHTFDVGRTVRAYVQTDIGVVFSDASGSVWSADGADVTDVGTINKKYPVLEADGTLAAWVEPGSEAVAPEFAVLDQGTGNVTRDALGNVPGMSDLRDDGPDPAVVYAIDGPVVYVRDHTGAVAWNLDTGDTRLLGADADGFTIDDVKNGQIAYSVDGQDGYRVAYRVGSDLTSGRDFSLSSAYFLSPNGRYLMAEPESDDVRILDTVTGEQQPKDDQGYDYFGGYQWIDDAHYAALGFRKPFDKTPVDILSCEVATGACVHVADGVGSLVDGLTIPIGEYNGD